MDSSNSIMEGALTLRCIQHQSFHVTGWSLADRRICMVAYWQCIVEDAIMSVVNFIPVQLTMETPIAQGYKYPPSK